MAEAVDPSSARAAIGTAAVTGTLAGVDTSTFGAASSVRSTIAGTSGGWLLGHVIRLAIKPTSNPNASPTMTASDRARAKAAEGFGSIQLVRGLTTFAAVGSMGASETNA